MSSPGDYTVGWICALPIEAVAATAFLDVRLDGPKTRAKDDTNNYKFGKINEHNVVIATPPMDENGATADSVVKNLIRSFPNVRIGLMVGIGGGAPTLKHDIRLGDVVVSSSGGPQSGVFQYDLGKYIRDEEFQPIRALDKPPRLLRAAVSSLEVNHEIDGNGIEDAITRILKQYPRLQRGYGRPSDGTDILFQPTVQHVGGDTCDICSTNEGDVVSREPREFEKTSIHHGVIASSNNVMKDATLRDSLASQGDVLCFEMEAAGLMGGFSCLVIRGICDYSDSHKNKAWQGYAAMAAAAYAKQIVSIIRPEGIVEVPRLVEIGETMRAAQNVRSKALKASDSSTEVPDDDGAWITSEFNEIAEPKAPLSFSFHQPRCAHRCQEVRDSDSDINTDRFTEYALREDMQTEISHLCGLGGVIPQITHSTKEPGTVNLFKSEDGRPFMKIIYKDKAHCGTSQTKIEDADRNAETSELVLQLHKAIRGLRNAAITLQRSHFCCDRFTVLTAEDFNRQGHGITVVRMNTVTFSVLDKLEKEIGRLILDDSKNTMVVEEESTCRHIMETLFHNPLPLPSTTGETLHLYSLTLQVLCLGITFYAQAHTGGLEPAYLAKPPSHIELRGSSCDLPFIVAERVQLSCMHEMVGDRVWAFRLSTQVFQAQPTGMYLRATCEEIVDCWGPASFGSKTTEPREDELYELFIRGGVVHSTQQDNEDVVRVFHWTHASEYERLFPQTSFDYRAEIMIGASSNTGTAKTLLGGPGRLDSREGKSTSLAENNSASSHHTSIEGNNATLVNAHTAQITQTHWNVGTQETLQGESSQTGSQLKPQEKLPGAIKINSDCHRSIEGSRKASQDDREVLGTSPSSWKPVARQAVFQAGYQAVFQFGMEWQRQPRVPLKRIILDSWSGRRNLLVFECPLGIQVSICTGVARRVPLRTIVLENLMEYIDTLGVKGWEKLKPRARTAMASKEAFMSWVKNLMTLDDEVEDRACVERVFTYVLNCLRNTGFDKDGNVLSILWPNKGEDDTCVKIYRSKHNWCEVLEDKEWSTSFVVLTDLCFTTSDHACVNKKEARWAGLRTLQTSMHRRTVGKDRSTCQSTDQSDDEAEWHIEDKKWYWNGIKPRISGFWNVIEPRISGFLVSRPGDAIPKLVFRGFLDSLVPREATKGMTSWGRWDTAIVECI
ncbi:nucleoside phosphorylase [Fusarium subglutinans]|uniref:Nucleoside phosphorylase n=1 Tax=Gibberella subglutinans TaxID=42677 RepID=A0A8H5Q0Z3_GIBSU|nr:nucleoside phosphorylase [Fusarium subglutinans]KAF5606224.1 nucleoside phosphorylase [Fusarium subglutinans]